LKGGRGDYFLKSHNSFASCQPLRALQEEEKKKKKLLARKAAKPQRVCPRRKADLFYFLSLLL
jgi:hypothetical protein